MHKLTSQDTDVRAKHDDWVYVLYFGKIWFNFSIAEGGGREKTPYPNPLFTKNK